ncbi:MAG: pentapeptide repeat-containing protein [Okeania sp. SIO2F4]|uniref:pentapeptide repeat-containing protein n=1 Tax=Okeania sp. SIO2F4 TaxID=2607790 RepID=UPI00142995D8|nr:pentapeptide repeat-containing protein [Okeania sp. SIO2F4]NES03901.1 pentapeptide repeat-containing protein [Okeania sp. SIO2F4]
MENYLENYRRRNLRGRSFKNQDLSHEDFSYSDIRGTNFTNANLTGANFSYALAGLTKSRKIILSILIFLLSLTSAFATFTAVYIPLKFIVPKTTNPIPIHIGLFIFLLLELINIGLLLVTIRQGIKKALAYLFSAIPLMMFIIPGLAAFAMSEKNLSKGFKFLGIDRPPSPEVIEFSHQLKAFRSGNLIEGVTNLLTDADSVNIVVSIIVSLIISVGAILVLITTLSLAVVLAEIKLEKHQKNSVITWSIIFTIIITGSVVKNLDDRYGTFLFSSEPAKGVVLGISTYVIAISISILLISIAVHLARKILAEDENNLTIRRLAVAIGAIGGTSFKNANLRETNFSNACLKSTDFRLANVTHTLWRQAEYLTFARVRTTILIDPKIRELLVTGNGRNKQYISVNLRGANLRNADLTQSNLTIADLSEAALEGACLDGANLKEVLAIGTNFTQAKMTGVCLESWNINHTTILDEIETEYIYLLESAKPQTNNRERRPSSGNFAPGDFTKLFAENFHTVDLIFRNGINGKAFMSAFQQVQKENEEVTLTIQSMENKGDGMVVIKISVPPEANKGKIHQQLTKFYQEDVGKLSEKYREKSLSQEEKISIYHQQSEYIMSFISEILTPQRFWEIQNLKLKAQKSYPINKSLNSASVNFWSRDSVYLPNISGEVQPKFADALAELAIAIEAEVWLTAEEKEEAFKQVEILAKVSDFYTADNEKLGNSALNILKEIIDKHPGAEWMTASFKL